MKEPFEWMRTQHYDPQSRIEELFRQLGHERTKWRYTFDEKTTSAVWRHEGTQCMVCGAWAMYGAQPLPGGRSGRRLAIWGLALEQECLKGPKLIGGIPQLPLTAAGPDDPVLTATSTDETAPG